MIVFLPRGCLLEMYHARIRCTRLELRRRVLPAVQWTVSTAMASDCSSRLVGICLVACGDTGPFAFLSS